MARSYNPSMAWDGSAWVEGTSRVWNGAAWTSPAVVRFFDGAEWAAKALAPVTYPTYATSNSALYGATEYAGLAVPAATRVNDLIVSVCASASAQPQLLSPEGHVAQAQQLSSGHWIAVAMWPYDGRPGDVVWRVPGSQTSTVMNLVYRSADVSSVPVVPVREIKQYAAVNRVPLTAPSAFTSLFVVLVESSDLTGYVWPEGVVDRAKQLGRFGDLNFSLLASDTPGAGASPGELVLDTTANAVCVTIQVPGVSDGRPTWILGDDKASALGATTVLG
ncbi:hypothetical protein [Streptomyces sp. NPDC018045]|uniref:hypothetical protein n=1 Tax=Streptomyces sp. NPDC018045 TaxID=3365037 RepID=UPI0037AF2508